MKKKTTTTKTPLLPRDNSQEDKILKHLKTKGSISNLKAVFNYRICRLSAVINRLRQKHWKIRTLDRKASDGTIYGEYKLARLK